MSFKDTLAQKIFLGWGFAERAAPTAPFLFVSSPHFAQLPSSPWFYMDLLCAGAVRWYFDF